MLAWRISKGLRPARGTNSTDGALVLAQLPVRTTEHGLGDVAEGIARRQGQGTLDGRQLVLSMLLSAIQQTSHQRISTMRPNRSIERTTNGVRSVTAHVKR